jgi:hypothetical protein
VPGRLLIFAFNRRRARAAKKVAGVFTAARRFSRFPKARFPPRRRFTEFSAARAAKIIFLAR